MRMGVIMARVTVVGVRVRVTVVGVGERARTVMLGSAFMEPSLSLALG